MNGKMGQQSDEVPLSGCNLPVPTAMGMDNELQTNHLEEGKYNSFWATVVPVDTSEDILEKLIPYAAEEEIFILGASGEVSYMELVNPPDAPVANTVLKGNFEISAIEGNIVWPKTHAKNKESHVTVLVAGSDGGIRGGPVRSLIAKSSIKVFVSTASKHDVHDMASEEYPTKIELPLFQFHDQAKRMEDVVDQIYKATLKELNQTITFP
ncbi:hypothetical protein VNO78_08590 [Psophocarpus tetragonolobus]|uniref:AT-hook motif nuclear-localized protein n=1 Tax=Psophocarpus tetragonolobus TaxID=3891 RepID=A0AAN9SV37_PSOTE